MPAGDLQTWVRDVTTAWESGTDVVVPCGVCNACCRSGFFVHVGPDERRTRERIPKALRFPAPGKPEGWIVIPHDDRGRCAMLGDDDRCTIYDDRPLTCRHFDCRVFAAAGIDAPAPISERRWAFEGDSGDVRAIAVHLRGRDADRAARAVTLSTIQLRPATAADDEWLYHLHRAAMRERVEEVYGPWDDDQQRAYFAAGRAAGYRVEIITKRDEPVGTLRTTDNDDGGLDIGLIEVHPDHQSRGIGTEVIRRLAVEASGDLTLQVMKRNRARRLYERLGFVPVGETDTHLQLRRPSSLLFETDPA